MYQFHFIMASIENAESEERGKTYAEFCQRQQQGTLNCSIDLGDGFFCVRLYPEYMGADTISEWIKKAGFKPVERKNLPFLARNNKFREINDSHQVTSVLVEQNKVYDIFLSSDGNCVTSGAVKNCFGAHNFLVRKLSV